MGFLGLQVDKEKVLSALQMAHDCIGPESIAKKLVVELKTLRLWFRIASKRSNEIEQDLSIRLQINLEEVRRFLWYVRWDLLTEWQEEELKKIPLDKRPQKKWGEIPRHKKHILPISKYFTDDERIIIDYITNIVEVMKADCLNLYKIKIRNLERRHSRDESALEPRVREEYENYQNELDCKLKTITRAFLYNSIIEKYPWPIWRFNKNFDRLVEEGILFIVHGAVTINKDLPKILYEKKK